MQWRKIPVGANRRCGPCLPFDATLPDGIDTIRFLTG
jgi:hypothetical protein